MWTLRILSAAGSTQGKDKLGGKNPSSKPGLRSHYRGTVESH